ncbi:MAG: bL28 family ribosomal protein [Patescibacteria group bacterium]|jgi:ribosomal protein L28
MALRCSVCGRGATKGASRSHSNRQTLKRQKINLQSKKIGDRYEKVCASCLKTSKKVTKK